MTDLVSTCSNFASVKFSFSVLTPKTEAFDHVINCQRASATSFLVWFPPTMVCLSVELTSVRPRLRHGDVQKGLVTGVSDSVKTAVAPRMCGEQRQHFVCLSA
ncbi:hypothetical protein JTB14_025058 [Gonioctena quinquepunctata]|nr:hypothetical protein JTB14_025058 [Gonioctena quinquepunctata]